MIELRISDRRWRIVANRSRDAKGDGWVLSSLHARTGTRIYAKTITAGHSDANLSEEETAAIRQATA